MKITLLVEGATESAFLLKLREFLAHRLQGRMPRLDIAPYHGSIPRGAALRREVELHLRDNPPADAVVALTDVYTGPSVFFKDAPDAKRKMRQWVGRNPKFHPHAAQFEFEAWLLPYWDVIQRLARRKKRPPRGNPELVNHQKPPSQHIKELFQAGDRSRHYSKVRDAKAILRDSDLNVAMQQCQELKALVNTILRISGGEEIP